MPLTSEEAQYWQSRGYKVPENAIVDKPSTFEKIGQFLGYKKLPAKPKLTSEEAAYWKSRGYKVPIPETEAPKATTPKPDYNQIASKAIQFFATPGAPQEYIARKATGLLTGYEPPKISRETPLLPIAKPVEKFVEKVKATPLPFSAIGPQEAGVIKGGAQLIEDFSTLENASLIALISKINPVSKIRRFISGGFAGLMAKPTYDAWQRAKEAYRTGDTEEAFKYGTMAVGLGTGGLLGAKEAIRKVPFAGSRGTSTTEVPFKKSPPPPPPGATPPELKIRPEDLERVAFLSKVASESPPVATKPVYDPVTQTWRQGEAYVSKVGETRREAITPERQTKRVIPGQPSEQSQAYLRPLVSALKYETTKEKKIVDPIIKNSKPLQKPPFAPEAKQIEQPAPPPFKAFASPQIAEKDPISPIPSASQPLIPPPVGIKSEAATSIKNAQVDKELEAMGKPPATHGERMTFEEARANAAKQIEADPFAGQKLVNSIVGKERPITATEDALLLHEQTRLKNERVKAEERLIEAQKTGDKTSIDLAKEEVDRVTTDFMTIGDVVTKAGTESALSLGHRRMMMKEDYSLAAMERAKQVAKDGKPLSAIEISSVKFLHDKINATQKAFDDYVAKTRGTQTDIAPEIKSLAERIVSSMETAADAARDRMRDKLSRLSAGVDPTLIADGAIIGSAKIARGTLEFSKWSKEMVGEFGEKIKPFLKDIWAASQKMFDDSIKKLAGTKKDKVKSAISKPRSELTDAQRISMATKAVERSIADLEHRIKIGDIEPKARGTKTPVTPELEALRARRDVLKAELQELRRPQTSLKSLKTRLSRQTADMLDRLERGNFEKKKKIPVEYDAEANRLAHENAKAKQQWNEALMKDKLAKRSLIQKIGGTALETINATRTLITGMDLPPILRQGKFMLLAHPFRTLKALPESFRAIRSEAGNFRAEQELLNRENYPLYERSGLDLTRSGQSLAQMEEAFMSRWTQKIPIFRALQRGYPALLNRIRADSFDSLAGNLTRTGKPTPAEAKAIANFINVATGRGNLSKNPGAAIFLNNIFFAPKYAVSRFQLILGQPLWKGTARTRKLIATEYARYLTGLAIVYGLYNMSGAEIEEDPRSSDFAKPRFGNTRLDPLSGLQQVTVLLSRLSTGETKTLKAGQVIPIRGEKVPYGGATSDTVIGRFLRIKLTPMLGAGVDILSGKNLVGEKTTPRSVVTGLTVPLSFRDIYEVMQERGVPAGIALSILALFGEGIQTFDASKKSNKAKPIPQKRF